MRNSIGWISANRFIDWTVFRHLPAVVFFCVCVEEKQGIRTSLLPTSALLYRFVCWQCRFFYRRVPLSPSSQTAVNDLPQEHLLQVFGLSPRTSMLSQGPLWAPLRHSGQAPGSCPLPCNSLMLFLYSTPFDFLTVLALSQHYCDK
jgi:hypothetical protein